MEKNAIGLRYAPLATRNHARSAARERVLEVAEAHPDKLTIELNALVTRVLFDDANRATGVEYLRGERLYRAHANPSDASGSDGAGRRDEGSHPVRRRLQHAADS